MPQDRTTNIVNIKELFVSFNIRPALDNISFSIKRGEHFGLIGESGSGKSLTALAIAGLLPPTAKMIGTIEFNGRPIPKNDKQMSRIRGRKIGMIFQEPMSALNPLMQVGKQIIEALKLHYGEEKIEERLKKLLKEVGLEEKHIKRYPHQLSGGQRQRIMIAIALAGEPELLICDEPTSALDLITQAKILSLLNRICEQRNMTLLFISHDLAAVSSLCQRVGVLKKGVLLEVAEIGKIFTNAKNKYTKLLVKSAKLNISPLKEISTRNELFSAHNIVRKFKQGKFLSFSKKAPLIAVNNVSFTIKSSESVALVGPSGCGKTTLARMIVGLDRADSGNFCLEKNIYGKQKKLPKNIRRDLALVFQDPFSSFNPRQKIGHSIAEPLRLLDGLSNIEKSTKIIRAIESVGLDKSMLNRYPHEFSGGQRQRLAIARALVTRPRLVVLDEPVSALDVSVRGEILSLLNNLRSEFAISFLLISHDLNMVYAVADRIMVMNAGRIVEQAEPKKLFSNPQHEITKQLLAARININY